MRPLLTLKHLLNILQRILHFMQHICSGNSRCEPFTQWVFWKRTHCSWARQPSHSWTLCERISPNLQHWKVSHHNLRSYSWKERSEEIMEGRKARLTLANNSLKGWLPSSIALLELSKHKMELRLLRRGWKMERIFKEYLKLLGDLNFRKFQNELSQKYTTL